MFLTANNFLACSVRVLTSGRATDILKEALSKTLFAFEFKIMEKPTNIWYNGTSSEKKVNTSQYSTYRDKLRSYSESSKDFTGEI